MVEPLDLRLRFGYEAGLALKKKWWMLIKCFVIKQSKIKYSKWWFTTYKDVEKWMMELLDLRLRLRLSPVACKKLIIMTIYKVGGG